MTTPSNETTRRREAYDAAAQRANAAGIEYVAGLCGGEVVTEAWGRYQTAHAERRATWLAYCEIMGVSATEVAA